MLFLYLLFAVSGFCGLLYETVFMKELTYLFGISAYAVSAVLAAFMAGLALGSWFFGKQNVPKPLVFYGFLELGVGFAGVCSLLLLRILMKVYPVFCHTLQENSSIGLLTVLRFFLAVPLAGLPGFFMGGTLPVFSQAISGKPAASNPRLVAAYSVNTLGGAVAAVAGAYYFVYHLGLLKTVLFSALLNGAVFLGALILDKLGQGAMHEQHEAPPSFNLPASSAYWIAFLTGFLSFVYEVVGFHLLGTIIGNTVYAFAIMLFTFLLAIVVSGYAGYKILKIVAAWRWLLPGSQFLAGLCILLTVPLWDHLGWVFAWVGQKNPTFFMMELTRFIVSFLLLFGSAWFLTQTFPLLFVFRDYGKIGERMGKLYGANTFGAILGALAGSFLFLPLLGSQLSLEVIGLADLLLGCALINLAFRWKRVMKMTLLLGVVCLFTAFNIAIPKWDIGALTSGNYVYFDESNRRGKVIYSHEDVLGGFTTVLQDAVGYRTLMTNGKFQGNTADESVAQRDFVRIPALFASRFQKALVIGLGTGQSLEAVLEYPFSQVNVAEISPGIVKASRTFFRRINRDALADKRVNLHLEDGRNFILCSKNQYDLISMELSSIWIAGSSNLYNREFYELCRAHLGSSGVMQQWIQIHHISLEDIARSLRTLSEVFAHVVFFVSGGQGIAAASVAPLEAHLHDLYQLKSFLTVWDVYLDERRVKQFLDDTARTSPLVSTDDQPILEYSTPYGNTLGGRIFLTNLEAIGAYSLKAQPPPMTGFRSTREKNLVLAFFYRGRNPALSKEYFRAAGLRQH